MYLYIYEYTNISMYSFKEDYEAVNGIFVKRVRYMCVLYIWIFIEMYLLIIFMKHIYQNLYEYKYYEYQYTNLYVVSAFFLKG
jgi:hypothetical protein